MPRRWVEKFGNPITKRVMLLVENDNRRWVCDVEKEPDVKGMWVLTGDLCVGMTLHYKMKAPLDF